MKSRHAFSLALVFLVMGSLFAEERPRVRVETDDHLTKTSEARQLVDAVADACNSGDSRAFLSHCTSRYGASIRSKIRERFASEDPEMRVLEVTLDSSAEKTMTFEARYLWEDSTGRTLITADVVAKQEDGHWKIDGEKMIGRKQMESQDTAFPENAVAQNPIMFLKPGDRGWDPDSPLDMPQIPGSCRGGQCGVPRPPDAPVVYLKPGDPGWDPDSPADIPQVPGSCQNGQCRVR